MAPASNKVSVPRLYYLNSKDSRVSLFKPVNYKDCKLIVPKDYPLGILPTIVPQDARPELIVMDYEAPDAIMKLTELIPQFKEIYLDISGRCEFKYYVTSVAKENNLTITFVNNWGNRVHGVKATKHLNTYISKLQGETADE